MRVGTRLDSIHTRFEVSSHRKLRKSWWKLFDSSVFASRNGVRYHSQTHFQLTSVNSITTSKKIETLFLSSEEWVGDRSECQSKNLDETLVEKWNFYFGCKKISPWYREVWVVSLNRIRHLRWIKNFMDEWSGLKKLMLTIFSHCSIASIQKSYRDRSGTPFFRVINRSLTFTSAKNFTHPILAKKKLSCDHRMYGLEKISSLQKVPSIGKFSECASDRQLNHEISDDALTKW